MKTPAILNNLKPFINSIGPKIVEKGPDLMVIGGTIGLVAAGIWACKVTADKVPEIIEDKELNEEFILNAQCPDRDPEETEKDREKSLKSVRRKARLKIVKAYALPVGLGIVSTASILCGNHIIRARYVAALAGMQGLQTAYDNYRSRIVEKFGEAADKYAAYGIDTEIVEVEEVGEDGQTRLVQEEREVINDITPATANSPYFRLITPRNSSIYRENYNSPLYVRNQLEIYQSVLNDMYDQGHPIYYNDMLTYIFGADESQWSDDGQIVGWYKYDKKNKAMGDKHINLRIGSVHNKNDETGKDEVWFYIDPNVFGPVRLGR